MNNEMKAILDNFDITNEEYNKILSFLENMDYDYHNNKDISKYDYESYVSSIIGDQNSHYPAEQIAIELYKMGEYKELIKNEIYKHNTKVLSELCN